MISSSKRIGSSIGDSRSVARREGDIWHREMRTGLVVVDVDPSELVFVITVRLAFNGSMSLSEMMESAMRCRVLCHSL